jgi:hypothetical protein
MKKREGKTGAQSADTHAPQNTPKADDTAGLRQHLLELADHNTDRGRVMMLVEQILKPESAHQAANALSQLLHLIGWQDDHDKRHGITFCVGFYSLLFRDDWLPVMSWLLEKIDMRATQTTKRRRR